MQASIRHKWSLTCLISFFIAVSLGLLFSTGSVSAATNRLPDPADDNTGGDMALVTSNRNPDRNNRLDAEVSIVKLFLPSGASGNFTIEGGGYCGFNQGLKSSDSLFSEDSNGHSTYFFVFSTDERERKQSFVAGTDDDFAGCGSHSIQINSDQFGASRVPGHEGYDVVWLEAWNPVRNSGNLNGFRYTSNIPGAIFSYYAGSGNKFALLERDGNTNSPPERHNITLRFAPNCTSPTEDFTTKLRWFDDDWNTVYQPTDGYYTELVEYNASGTPTGRTQRVLPNFGEDRDGSADVTVRGRYTYKWTWYGVNENNGIQFQLPFDSFNSFINCEGTETGPDLTCGNLTPNPSSPEVGDQFSFTINFFNDGSAAFNDPNRDLRIVNTGGLSIPPPLTKDYTPASVPPGGGSGQAVFSNVSGSPGEHTVVYELTGGGDVTGCEGIVRIVAKPYLRAYGSDVITGGGFANSTSTCTLVQGARFIGFNTSGAGSAAQLAVQALGQNDGFTSATGRGSPPREPKGLTFANTVGGTYGGNFGAASCIKDYFSRLSGTDPGEELTSRSINGQVIYKRSGHLRITGPITYANTSWSDLSQIPRLYVVVKGNIYIQAGVPQLDGIYIAQPTDPENPTDGYIYTCASGTSVPGNLFDDCDDKLTVNGALIMQRLRPFRTRGSLSNSGNAEPGSSPDIAESIIFGPEVYLSPGGGAGSVNYDAITSLPPVL